MRLRAKLLLVLVLLLLLFTGSLKELRVEPSRPRRRLLLPEGLCRRSNAATEKALCPAPASFGWIPCIGRLAKLVAVDHDLVL